MITFVALSRLIRMKGNYTIMKNELRNSKIAKNRMRVALLLALTTCIISLAPAFSTSASAGSFSINDVSGNYVWHSEGWTLGGTNGKQSVPLSAVGLITYTPATGTFHSDLIVRLYGTNFHPVRDGTYTVDATGHGTMTSLTESGSVRQIDFYIVNGGAQLKWIITDPTDTTALSTIGTMTKQ
jgi:pectate lyase